MIQTECPDCHVKLDVRQRVLANGSRQHWLQCPTCGRTVGSAIKAELAYKMADGPMKLFDEAAKRQWEDACFVEMRERKQAWWDSYGEYLQSDEWRAKRRAVYERDGGICRGCLQAPIKHIHHLTYDHVGQELLFELIGLCEACHDRVHHSHPLLWDDLTVKPRSSE